MQPRERLNRLVSSFERAGSPTLMVQMMFWLQ
jgi:hypothetical protein